MWSFGENVHVAKSDFDTFSHKLHAWKSFCVETRRNNQWDVVVVYENSVVEVIYARLVSSSHSFCLFPKHFFSPCVCVPACVCCRVSVSDCEFGLSRIFRGLQEKHKRSILGYSYTKDNIRFTCEFRTYPSHLCRYEVVDKGDRFIRIKYAYKKE